MNGEPRTDLIRLITRTESLRVATISARPADGWVYPSRLLVTYWRAAASYDCGGYPMSDRLFLARR
jgi:hypothetical protein